MTKRPYTYTVLRYVHDAATCEFVNIGVLLVCPQIGFLEMRLRTTHGRLSAMFPDLDRKGFRLAATSVGRQARRLAKEFAAENLFRESTSALHIAHRIMPADDGALQWSALGAGLTSDPAQALSRLFDRLVAQYDEKSPARRSDEDVWRPLRERLVAKKIEGRLQEKVIHGTDDSIDFKHAWKNGRWHCLQPLSFDLASADTIKDKARRWTGHLAAVRDTREAFKPYFVVAGPQDEGLRKAYQSALAILAKSPVEAAIFSEDQADQLVEQIEREIREHDALEESAGIGLDETNEVKRAALQRVRISS